MKYKLNRYFFLFKLINEKKIHYNNRYRFIFEKIN